MTITKEHKILRQHLLKNDTFRKRHINGILKHIEFKNKESKTKERCLNPIF